MFRDVKSEELGFRRKIKDEESEKLWRKYYTVDQGFLNKGVSISLKGKGNQMLEMRDSMRIFLFI